MAGSRWGTPTEVTSTNASIQPRRRKEREDIAIQRRGADAQRRRGAETSHIARRNHEDPKAQRSSIAKTPHFFGSRGPGRVGGLRFVDLRAL